MTPIDILIQLLEECGYTTSHVREVAEWDIVTVTDYTVPNSPIKFTAAVNDHGDVWLSKSSKGSGDVKINLHDTKSINLLKKELLCIKKRNDRPEGSWMPRRHDE